ncbi:DUF6364 family protein [Flavimarina sp. Hel_I_48]|uniref:DUF6364 family protein n=1 Tax=Flavimarina sp. Hel_I_48 TaxID=1392488 RepID=UPI00056B02F8|nr:DUF6364 family protein [Flavimarina sp. Hel_I_48]
MDAKLTLKLDKKVISDLKKYAKEHETSISRLLENYARKLTRKKEIVVEEPLPKWLEEIAEITSKYPADTRTDEEMQADYDAYRDKKYGG